VATTAQNYCAYVDTCPVNPATATIVYAGAAPSIVAGVTQFNVKLPATPTLARSIFAFYRFGSTSEPSVAVWVAP